MKTIEFTTQQAPREPRRATAPSPAKIKAMPHSANLPSSTRSPLLSATAILWLLASILVLAYSFYLALFVAPTEATMGNVYRIFFWHVPSSTMGLVFPYVNFAASLAFLFFRRRNPAYALIADALAVASAELTLVFLTICLATGMLWGKAAWGIWWAWDARLTSLLLLWLLYIAYLMTRRLSATGQTSTVGAVIAVFAAIDVPIVYYSIQWWRTQHPAPVLRGEGSLDPSMAPALYWSFLGWFLWGVFACAFRFAIERRRQHVEQAAARLALEAALAPRETFPHPNPEPHNAF